MANTPLPPNITWQTKEENGISIDFIPSPFGVGAYMASLKDSLVITSNEAALKEIASAGSDALLQGNELIKVVEKAAKSPIFATYISYKNFVTLMTSFASTLQMFAPQQAGLDPQQFDYMKHMGEVAIMGRYDPGVLRVSFGQMLPK